MAHIVNAEGFKGLWRGFRATLVMGIPATALYMTVYDELREMLMRRWKDDPYLLPWSPLVAGTAGRSMAVAVVSPLELVRTKLQATAGGRESGVVAALLAEVRESGSVSSLWRGLVSTLWRDVPFSAVYWLGYERIKWALAAQWVEAQGERGQRLDPATGLPASALASFAISFISGASAGSVAAILTTPFDVIKTRQQAASVGNNLARQLLAVARAEGIGGLFSGIEARLAKVAPACAIMISSYEISKRMFRDPDCRQQILQDV